MTLQDIAKELEGCAEAAWEKAKAEAVVIEQELEPVVSAAFSHAVTQFGQLATETVISLMTAAYQSLTGGAKLNLTVTTLIDSAEKQGVALAQADASALANNAYVAVIGKAPPAAG